MNLRDSLTKQLQMLLNEPQNSYFKHLQWQTNNPEHLCQLCCHYNGFIREKAVILLGIMRVAQAIPVIIERLNDWVPQVRLSAKQSLFTLLVNQNAEVVVSCLPQLYQLLICRRDDHIIIVNQVIRFLLQQENQCHIINAIFYQQPKIARLSLQLVIDHQLLSDNEVINRCLSHSDVLVRLIAVKLFLTNPSSVSQREILMALHNSFAPIRLLAIQYLNEHTSLLLKRKEIEKLLFDSHSCIRVWAITQLQKMNVDVLSYYLQILHDDTSSAKKLGCALWGMGVIPHPNVVFIVRPFIQHQHPSVRRVALQTLVKVLTDSAKDLLLNSLMDASPTVTKEAVRLFIKQKISLSLAELQVLTEEVRQMHQLMACNQLTSCLNKWDQLAFLLGQILLTQHSDAISLLYRWYEKFNQSGVQPSSNQIKLIVSLLDNSILEKNIKCYQALCNIMAFFNR